MPKPDSHVFVGSEVGLLKDVDIDKNTFSNLNFSETLCKDDEITAMCWGDSSEKKIYFGHRNQIVKLYDCDSKSISTFENSNLGEGAIRGLYCYNGNIMTAVESGIVKLWNEDSDKEIEINTGGNLCRMVSNPFKMNQIATGGEKNNLKVWDLNNHSLPCFKAKNVKNDCAPAWITDMQFRTDDKIVTCTMNNQIRLYDPKDKKPPVIDMKFECDPLLCMSLAHNEDQVIVGTSKGRMALIDLRMERLVHVFKGFAGSIRCVQCHPSLPLVASCGLDRFLRIHDLNTRELIKKIYLKTRLNCLLMRKSVSDVSKPKSSLKPLENKDALEADEEEEHIWKSMAVISEKIKKRKQFNVTADKNKKSKIEVSPSWSDKKSYNFLQCIKCK